ncbi:MBL fold metallo-hydrolase [Pararhizobium capsulatum]|uniref:MBL fold metallo-hydrolase n=1 Tax=Pararhizobium capsulatum TaxID=34014 RepID=UPI0027D92B61|nr:MBL fold metallo-hydrolase [Pararhizobium capsulatum]
MDCGHSKANDESVWTPGGNIGKPIEFSSTCYLIRHGSDILLWDTGVPDDTVNNLADWSTLPKLIVYHLERTITSQLAEIGLKPEDVNFVLVSHTHGDHIGNVRLFPDATVVMQKAEQVARPAEPRPIGKSAVPCEPPSRRRKSHDRRPIRSADATSAGLW